MLGRAETGECKDQHGVASPLRNETENSCSMLAKSSISKRVATIRWAPAAWWIVASALGGAFAGSPAGVVWLTGQALQTRLDATIPKVFWSGAPLRAVIRSLSTTQRIAILMDRRVDPEQPVDLSMSDVAVRTILDRIAEPQELGWTMIGSAIYLGPAKTAKILRTLSALKHDEVAKLPAGAATVLRRSEPLTWEDFATPRELLTQLAQSAGRTIEGLDQVPHDLWAAGDLPPLPWIDRLTLLAVQFDLTFRIGKDGRSLELTPLPDRVALVRRYPGGQDPQRLARHWAEQVPDSQIKVVGSEVWVRGLVEDHERLASASGSKARGQAKREATPRGASGKRQELRFTVQNAKGPLDRILAELGQKLGIEVKIDGEALARAGISPQQIVAFSVQDATVDALFEAVLRPAGCTFRREGSAIVVVPAPP